MFWLTVMTLKLKVVCIAMKGVKLCDGVGCLRDLQMLSLVEENHQGVGLFTELGKLSQLRTLDISNMAAENGRDLCAFLQNMVQLKILVVSSINEEEILDLQSISSPPQFLEHIFLRGG
jgi:disease resistance protein RPM1